MQLSGGELPTAADYARLLDHIRGRVDFNLLQQVLLRSLAQAQYRPDNEGHFGLAYDAYAARPVSADPLSRENLPAMKKGKSRR